jgi:hypothetical protein
VREKQRLGELFGLKGLGVNLTRLPPGAQSALLHSHSVQEEFVYVLKALARRACLGNARMSLSCPFGPRRSLHMSCRLPRSARTS